VRVLVVNAGSSSLKLRLLGPDDDVLAGRDLNAPGGRAADGALAAALDELGPPDAAGHRLVHGGPRFTAPVLVDDEVLEGLREVAELAPLHVPPALEALAAVRAALPGVPDVACFDTAFHATLPPEAFTYAVPLEWRERLAVRRYGFHGLSHAYAARRTAELLGRQDLRLVTCHLGAGSSLCAVRDGRSVDTTMGFTPLEGLVMATRSGTVDPGLVTWLVEHAGLGVEEVARALERESGLQGLAGTPDMREVLAREDDEARLALAVFVHRLRAEIAAMAAALGGLDALCFTGGIGERSAPVRALAAEGLGFLGVAVDPGRNEAVDGDGELTASGAAVRTVVVAAREDLEIARQVRAVLHS
jgi:acetate kinase